MFLVLAHDRRRIPHFNGSYIPVEFRYCPRFGGADAIVSVPEGLKRKEMMSTLRKALAASFVLLSAVLFTAFLPLVFIGLTAFYGYQYSQASRAPAVKCDDGAPSAPAVRPFYTAIGSYMTSWVSITAGLSLSVTAAIFVTIRLIILSIRQVAHENQALARFPQDLRA